MKAGVIGVPKTIDNDISFVQRTFGFETAVTEARRATYAASVEAEAARNGGLARRGYATIVIAEGARQDLMANGQPLDMR